MEGLFREYCQQQQQHQHQHQHQHDSQQGKENKQYKKDEELIDVRGSALKGSALELDVLKATILPLAVPSPARLTKPSPLLLLEALTARVADEAITLERCDC